MHPVVRVTALAVTVLLVSACGGTSESPAATDTATTPKTAPEVKVSTEPATTRPETPKPIVRPAQTQPGPETQQAATQAASQKGKTAEERVADLDIDRFTELYERPLNTYSEKSRGYNMALGLLNDNELNLIVEELDEAVTLASEKMLEISNAVDADEVRAEMTAFVELLDELANIDERFKERMKQVRDERR